MEALTEDQKKPKFAYVVLIMLNDNYVNGAIVTAYSIRLVEAELNKKEGLNVHNDLICMYANSADSNQVISEDARERLSKVFDKVIPVPLLEIKIGRWGSPKQRETYGNWIKYAPTKWNCLSLTEYDKVMMLDADIIIHHDISHLFALPCPVGSFTNPWLKPFKSKGSFNPYYPIKMGDKVNNETIKRVLGNKNPNTRSVVMISSCVVLEPTPGLYEEFCEFLSGLDHDFSNCTSGADEQTIALFYLSLNKTWTHIDQRYNNITRHPTWIEDLGRDTKYFVTHYVGEKPWQEKRNKWDDFLEWWQVYDQMIIDYPELAFKEVEE